MKIPEWTGTALWGAVGGAVGFSLIGFNYMGWVLGCTAIKMSEEASKTAVVEALTPYCVSASETDPLSVEKLDKIEKAMERDNFMAPEEALSFGLIDEVVEKRPADQE